MTRSFVLASALPLPASGGGALRAWQHVVALAAAGPVGVFGLRADKPAPPPREGIELWCSSGDPSLTDPALLSSLDWLRDPAAVPSDRYCSSSALAELEEAIERFRPDVVVLAFQAHCCPSKTKGVRCGREVARQSGPQRGVDLWARIERNNRYLLPCRQPEESSTRPTPSGAVIARASTTSSWHGSEQRYRRSSCSA
jgi:hypothetical protein